MTDDGYPHLHHEARAYARVCPLDGKFVTSGHSDLSNPTQACPIPWEGHVEAVQVVQIFTASTVEVRT